jgi:hypothetical protein
MSLSQFSKHETEILLYSALIEWDGESCEFVCDCKDLQLSIRSPTFDTAMHDMKNLIITKICQTLREIFNAGKDVEIIMVSGFVEKINKYNRTAELTRIQNYSNESIMFHYEKEMEESLSDAFLESHEVTLILDKHKDGGFTFRMKSQGVQRVGMNVSIVFGQPVRSLVFVHDPNNDVFLSMFLMARDYLKNKDSNIKQYWAHSEGLEIDDIDDALWAVNLAYKQQFIQCLLEIDLDD